MNSEDYPNFEFSPLARRVIPHSSIAYLLLGPLTLASVVLQNQCGYLVGSHTDSTKQDWKLDCELASMNGWVLDWLSEHVRMKRQTQRTFFINFYIQSEEHMFLFLSTWLDPRGVRILDSHLGEDRAITFEPN